MIPKYADLTDDQRRVLIAEACGRVRVEVYEWESETVRKPKQFHIEDDGYIWNAPNYLADLNACHEMEKALSERQRCLYGKILWEVVPSEMWHASARLRAEAFGRTLNLWT